MFGHDDSNQAATNAATTPAVPAAPVAGFTHPEDIALGGAGSEPAAPSAPVSADPIPSLPPSVDPPSSLQIPSAAPLATPVSTAPTGSLENIKQEALQALTPLVSHLEQSPEEKFRTTMMLLQATDDQSLIPGAYEAAKQIMDEKARAQALLDVVNEINYFNQQKSA